MKKITLLVFVSFVYLVANFTVSFAGGEVFVVKNDLKTRLKTGDVVGKNDIIQTGNRSFVSLSDSDGSVYKVYANSSLKVEKYINNDEKRVKTFSFLKGKIFSFISKTFRKSDIKILTKNGVVAVKGTSFLLENRVDKFDVYLLEGKLSILDEDYNPLASITAGQVASKFREVGEVEIRQLNQKELEQINQDVNINVRTLQEEIVKKENLKEVLKKEAINIVDAVENIIKNNQEIIIDQEEITKEVGSSGEKMKQTKRILEKEIILP